MNHAVAVRNRDYGKAPLWLLSVAAIGLATLMTHSAAAQVYINELFWDAGGDSGDDERDEYIELRGTPGYSLANHYLIFLEAEDNSSHTGHAGEIDGWFDFNIAANGGVASIGTNGFLTLRQKGNLYDGVHGGVAAGTTDLVNAGVGPDSDAWGNNAKTPGSSTVGFSWEPNINDDRNVIENGGWTAILIRDDSGTTPPALNWEPDPIGQPGVMKRWDLDNGNNGLDSAASDDNNWRDAWTFVDAIGVFTEGNEVVRGRTYAQVNIGNIPIGGEIIPGTGILFTTPNIEPGAEYYGTEWSGREIEYLGRWGNSTGQTAADWHASNVTDRVVAGSAGAPDYRQSGDPHPSCFGCALPPDFEIESSKDVAYGTPILATLGGPNLGFVAPELLGDYNGNDEIDAADYTVWRDAVTAASTSLPNDPTPGTVDESDFLYWRDHFGETLGGGAGAGSAAVPEPASLVLLTLAGATLAGCRQRRRRSTDSVSFAD